MLAKRCTRIDFGVRVPGRRLGAPPAAAPSATRGFHLSPQTARYNYLQQTLHAVTLSRLVHSRRALLFLQMLRRIKFCRQMRA
jgi:hypothetical protein